MIRLRGDDRRPRDFGAPRREISPTVAVDRAEDEPCQRGTVGCSVDHAGDEKCETW